MQNSNIPQSTPDSQPNLGAPPQPPKRSFREGWGNVASTILILVAAPLIAWLLISFVFQSYEVDGLSMETTLQDHDRLIVLKTGKTWSRITHKAYIPKRGDIVIFTKRGLYEFGQQDEKQLIKRVIALPGERVVIKDGDITVYNDQFPGGFKPDEAGHYHIIPHSTNDALDVTIPAGQIFVCGDNRGNSLDSRTFGPISINDVIGNLTLRIFPLNKLDAY